MPTRLKSWLAVPVCALLASAVSLAAPGAASAATTGGDGPLSPELTELATPAVAAQSAPAQAEAVGLPAEGPGSLAREGERVIVEAHFEAGALARVEELEATGAKVLVASSQYQTVALSIEPEDLRALAEVPGISNVAPSRRPVFYGAEGGASTAVTSSACEGGSVISQGVQQLNVPAARAAFGARGAGETVGVISDSFNSATNPPTRAANDEASNDLPGPVSSCAGQQVPVRVIEEGPSGSTDEGRAMLQVIHDVAPEAQLAFATAEGGELRLARNIERLAEPVAAGGAGAGVIVDDVAYVSEPFFQEGPVAVAIQKVKAEGVTYLTAAGNDNLIDSARRDIASWEAPRYKPIACPAALNTAIGETSNGCMNFSPTGTDSTFNMTVAPHGAAFIDLQWAEPWFGVSTDLDAYLFSGSNQLLAKSEFDSIQEEIPFEYFEWENESANPQSVYLVINRCSGPCNPEASAGTPRLKFAVVDDGSGVTETEYPQSAGEDIVGPTIFGHAGSAAAITLGAVNYAESASAPKEPEYYSSRGPVTHYFGPITSTTPAAALAAPEELRKPNLTATDCASTTFFAQLVGGAYYFCGTSEAAPQAAAVAALMRQINPLASPAAIAAAMEASATKYTSVTSPEAVGAGLLNAAGALTTLGTPPAAQPAAVPSPVVTITEGPKALGKENRPTFEFSSTRPVSFTCQIDGGAAQSCASPYVVPSKLADGAHGFVVTGTDAEGLSGTSSVYEFTIDTKAPRTTIVVHPKKVIKTRKSSVVGRFRVRADEAPVTFYCQFDKEALRICGKTFHRRFTPGVHVVKVRAMDALGNLAAGWTRYKFRVKQVGS